MFKQLRNWGELIHLFYITDNQGFMQDKIIASHTCFGGHMDVNC